MNRRLLKLVRTLTCSDCARSGIDACDNTCEILISAAENFKAAFRHVINWHAVQLKTCQVQNRAAHVKAKEHLEELIREPVNDLISRSNTHAEELP